MKLQFAILVIVCGGIAGWMLPKPHSGSHGDSPAVARDRETRKNQVLDELLDFGDRQCLKVTSAATMGELLAAIREGSSMSAAAAGRIVDMEPATALEQWLTDPSVPLGNCQMIAEEWARRNPEQAIRFLWNQQSYRAEYCLDKVLLNTGNATPDLAGEVIRSKSRKWQMKHLEELFTGTSRVRKPGAPPPPASDDPFEEVDDGQWITKRNGEDWLDDLADDELRNIAVGFWTKTEPKVSEAVKPKPTLDVARFDANDYAQMEVLQNQLKDNPDLTLATVAALGGFEIRKTTIQMTVGNYFMAESSWPADFEKLETRMRQLGAIPEYPPFHFEMGYLLHGDVAAKWVSRQAPGLQRAWSPGLVEHWVEIDPKPALDWARSLPADANRDLAVQTGIIIWAHQRPLEASAYVETMPPGDMRESAISNTAASWSRVDRTGAKLWVESLAGSPGRTRGLQRLE